MMCPQEKTLMKAFETCFLFIFYIPYCFACEKPLLSKPETNHCAVALFHVRKNWPGYNHTLFFITLIFNALENNYLETLVGMQNYFFMAASQTLVLFIIMTPLHQVILDYSWYIPEPGN